MTMPDNDRPITLISPPLALGLITAASLALDAYLPLRFLPHEVGATALFGYADLALAVYLLVAATRTLKTANTPARPGKPTLKLVESGPYAFSRNPMYLAMIIALVGLAFAFGVDWALLGAIVLFVVLHFGVVLREESHLRSKFGADYEAYFERTRRWL